MIRANYEYVTKTWTVHMQNAGSGRVYQRIGKASLLRLTRIALEYGYYIDIH